ncbi:hypothetical protein K438DRAFT_1760882 [Mycena galopus ATCC 62051]|nr:hypothetical protein K438DRAFT_1760882 [Mycena galopus ATCC 62051]
MTEPNRFPKTERPDDGFDGGILNLEIIVQIRLLNSEFAPPAACQTAKGDTDLVNGAFHLGGGFMTSGFQSAITTMWGMNGGWSHCCGNDGCDEEIMLLGLDSKHSGSVVDLGEYASPELLIAEAEDL